MTKRTTFSYVYFLTRVLFIGYGFSFLLNITNKDSWISFLIGSGLSCLLIFLIMKIKKNYQTNEFLKEPGHILMKSLYGLFALFLAIEILFIFQTLASSFFLVKSPHFYIILPALFLIYRICQKSWTTIGRVGTILMYLSLFIVIIALLTLTTYVDKENFLPILTVTNGKIIQSSLYYVAYSTAPLLYMILIPKTDDSLLKYYALANCTVFIMGILIIGILGPNLINIYRYPEYMVLKGIKFLNFIEKIENIFTITTLFDLFMALAISMNIVKEKLPAKRKNIYFILLLILVFSASLLLGIHYNVALQIYYYLPVILLGFILLILTGFTLHFIGKKKH